MTKALYFPHGPKKNTSGMPSEKKAGALEINKTYIKLIINTHTQNKLNNLLNNVMQYIQHYS